jgi:L-rhamnose mutarotase
VLEQIPYSMMRVQVSSSLPSNTWEKMRENPKVREWWKMTDGYQESLVPGAVSSEAGEPSWWKGLEEVFYYDGAAK